MRWNRRVLKERAKDALAGRYWKAVLIGFIFSFFGGGSGGANLFFQFRGGNNKDDVSGVMGDVSSIDQVLTGEVLAIMGSVILIFVIVFSIVLGVSMVFDIFLSSVMQVGCIKYFLENAETTGLPEGDEGRNIPIGTVGYGFKRGRYLNIVGTMLLRKVYIFLWSLLLVIPGIMKSYSYMMVPYILADNPNIGMNRALELSEEMTYGHRWNMFVLGLSFIGRFILGFLAVFIGVYFLAVPQYTATFAELYRTLRQYALDDKLCTYEELNFHHPA